MQPGLFLVSPRFKKVLFWVIAKLSKWEIEAQMLVKVFWKYSNAAWKSGTNFGFMKLKTWS